MARELLMMQNSFQWEIAEGQTLEIENAIRSNASDLKIEGQTYQNLIDFTTQESTQGITLDQENSVITFMGTLDKFILRLKTFKPNTKYTLITNVLNIPSNPDTPIRINDDGSDYNYNILGCLCTSLGINKVTFTTLSNISNLQLVLYGNDRNADYKFTFPIIIEGDFTNTDLPILINGIESVAEREKEGNLYPIKIAQSPNETLTKINLPQPLRSLPNGVCDEVVGNKLIQRVGKIIPTSTNVDWSNSLYNINKDGVSTYIAHGSFNSVKYCGKENINLICDKIPVGGLNAEALNYNIMVYGHSTTRKELRIAVPKTLLPNATIGEFKEWLDGNPVTLYYELETPIEHTINVPRVPIAKGSNIITTTNNIKPNLSMKYKKIPTTSSLYNLGDECIKLTGRYLINTNNSATCNIEKQADSLYVNCTGKPSFNSICYARTNKTIKPCKIKVSVKKNSISATGIAFCMFLSEKEVINSVDGFNSVVNKKYIKASNTTQGRYIDLEIDLTDNTEGYFYIFCMVTGSAGYTCNANIRKIEIIR